MSSTIKRPGSGGPVLGADAPPEPGGAEGARGATEFRAELEKAVETASDASSSVEGAGSSVHGAGRTDLVRSLSEDLRAGRLEPQQAIDRLVERALGGAAESLPPARRAELEALLRSTLADDPTLVAMQRDLSRDR